MNGLILRLAGPMQSWGEHSTFSERDTVAFPTRSGLLGVFAAAMGLRRGTPLDTYGFGELTLTVRVDRPGVPLTDFHTVGGGFPAHRTVPTAEGKRRSGDTGTIVSRRRYLADASFTVAVEGPTETLAKIEEALRKPVWHPYLGRRSCPPDQPILLRTGVTDINTELRTRVPVARSRPSAVSESAGIDVDFVRETTADHSHAVTELADVPSSFDRFNRRYQRRTVTVTPEPVSADLCHRPGKHYQTALHTYVKEGQP